MYHQRTFPPPAAHLGQFARIIRSFGRDQIELAVEMLIARLDAQDGDPDLEDDDRGAVMMFADGADFDPFAPPPVPDGFPGDPDDAEDGGDLEPDDDAKGDIAWVESHGRGGVDMPMLCIAGWPPHEDAEEDDDSGGNVEDTGEEGSWPESEECGHMGVHAYRDDDREPADRSLMLLHRDRLRLTRCRPRRWGEFELIDGDRLPMAVQP